MEKRSSRKTNSAPRLVVVPPPATGAEELQAVEHAAAALRREDLSIVNVDIGAAATRAVSVVPTLRPLRASMASLPGFEIQNFDRLELYAQALMAIHTKCTATLAVDQPRVRTLRSECIALVVTLSSL
jgi:hypothetical protein